MALLRHLASLESLGSGPASRELWRAAKGGRQLVCRAVYLPHGIDLRLLEDGDIRRTVLLRDGPAAEARAREWRDALIGHN
jgi:hypothetical protein